MAIKKFDCINDLAGARFEVSWNARDWPHADRRQCADGDKLRIEEFGELIYAGKIRTGAEYALRLEPRAKRSIAIAVEPFGYETIQSLGVPEGPILQSFPLADNESVEINKVRVEEEDDGTVETSLCPGDEIVYKRNEKRIASVRCPKDWDDGDLIFRKNDKQSPKLIIWLSDNLVLLGTPPSSDLD